MVRPNLQETYGLLYKPYKRRCWKETVTNHKHRIDDSEQCLKRFNRIKHETNASIYEYNTTTDETWLDNFTPQYNQRSSEWAECDESGQLSNGVYCLKYAGNDSYRIFERGKINDYCQIAKNKTPFEELCHKSMKRSAKANESARTSNACGVHQIVQICPLETLSCPQIRINYLLDEDEKVNNELRYLAASSIEVLLYSVTIQGRSELMFFHQSNNSSKDSFILLLSCYFINTLK